MTTETYPTADLLGHARNRLGKRVGVVALISRIEKDPAHLHGVLDSIDVAAGSYNSVKQRDLNGLWHIQKAKRVLPVLPTIRGLILETDPRQSLRTLQAFDDAMHHMDNHMRRYEEAAPEPNVGFHQWPNVTDEDRIAACALWAYGLTATGLSLKGSHHDAPDVVDALLEATVYANPEQRENPLYQLAIHRNRFDATDSAGQYAFSPEIRAAASGLLGPQG